MGETTSAQLISQFEALVDELIKPRPDESKVKILMDSLDLEYSEDAIFRISSVIEKMNHLIFTPFRRKAENDL